MTELQRLEISGIRSFKANPTNIDTQSIDFDGPITLITGENGTGKTTIIEALKFATMGKCTEEMVTDPNIWGKDEIESRVSLTFKSANQNTYKITLTPSVKKTLNTKKEKSFKKGDCEVITTTPDNTHKTSYINSKDIENQVPNFFGVSPPIIENVIFCHQKDSCWPIDCSTRELKEKFDQIFGAEKYNAAIKALKDTLKSLKDNLNQIKIEVAKHNGRQESYLKCQKKILEYKKQIIEFDQIISEKQLLYDKVDAPVQEYNKIRPEIEEKSKLIQSFKVRIQIEKKSIDELKGKITNLQPKDTYKSSLESTTELKASSNETLINDKKLLNFRKEERNSLEKEKNDLSNQFEKLSQKLKSLESQHNFYIQKLDEFKNKYGSENLDVILQEKRDALAQAEDDLENLDKKEVDDKDKQIREKERELTGESTKLFSLQNSLKDNQKELSKIKKVDESELTEAEKNYHKAKYDLDNFEIPDSQDMERRINSIKEEEKALLETKRNLQSDLERCEKYTEINSKLNSAKEQLANAEKQIDYHLKKMQDGLNDQTINSDNAAQVLNQKCDDLRITINKLTKESTTINTDFISLSEQYKSEKLAFDKSQKKANESKEKINLVLPEEEEDYRNQCELTEKCLNDANNELARLIKSKEVYANFKHVAESGDPDGGHSCPLCKRKFHDEDECKKFVREQLDKFINNLPEEINKAKITKKMFEDRLKNLKKIENDVQTYEDFQNKKADWEAKILSLQDKRNEMDEKLKQVRSQISDNETQLKALDKLTTNAAFLSEALKEKQKASENIKSLSSKIDNNLPSRDEIQSQLNQNQENLDRLSNEKNELYSDQNRKTKQSIQLKEKYQKYLNEFNTLKDIFDKKHSIEIKIESINKDIEFQNDEVNTIKNEIEKLNNEFKELSSNYDQQLNEMTRNKNNARDEFKDCQDLSSQIKKTKDILDELESGDKSKELLELKGKLDTKIAEYEQVSKDVDNLNKNISDLNDRIRELEKEERNLVLQGDYYKKLDDLEDLEAKMKKLEIERSNKLGNLEKMNIEELLEEQTKYKDELIEASTNKKNAEDQKKSLEDEVERDYKTCSKDLSEATIRQRSTELAISDIERYTKALDKTILDYHSQKMAEINDTIQYLWSNTYFGQDIDTIYIRCEEEKAKNAQYNYRVVMKKNNIELDMDRRCSAGQKMLASIIIRLALAQTFALNCGIIALDEPTTNLDEPNRKNLANQLIDLVNAQEKDNAKKPFQLIIITHNREFVESLVEEGTLDSFYQITRGIEDSHLCSQIRKCSETNLVVRQ